MSEDIEEDGVDKSRVKEGFLTKRGSCVCVRVYVRVRDGSETGKGSRQLARGKASWTVEACLTSGRLSASTQQGGLRPRLEVQHTPVRAFASHYVFMCVMCVVWGHGARSHHQELETQVRGGAA